MSDLPGLRRVRLAVRATLTLGLAASLAANILHAQPNPVSQVIAGWSPLALLLTVELISRIPVDRRGLAVVRLAATAAIAGIAAWVSYWHMVGVALRAGETDSAAHLLPLSVDGLVIVASVSLVELAGRIRVAARPASPALAAPAPAALVEPVTEPALIGDDEQHTERGRDVGPVESAHAGSVPAPAARTPRPRRRPATQTDQRAAARLAYLASVDDGKPLTGKEIGALYGKSERWGRERISQAKDARPQSVRRLMMA